MEETTVSPYPSSAWVGVISVPVKARLNKKVKLLPYKSAFLRDFPSALDIRQYFFSLHLRQFFSREVSFLGIGRVRVIHLYCLGTEMLMPTMELHEGIWPSPTRPVTATVMTRAQAFPSCSRRGVRAKGTTQLPPGQHQRAQGSSQTRETVL